MLRPQGHPGTKALNSGVWGGAPELAPEIALPCWRQAPWRPGIGYSVRLHTRVSYPARSGAPQSFEGRLQCEKVAEIFVRKFTEKIAARYKG
jgi:hypothetical protein